MTSAADEHFTRTRPNALLWYGLLIGPIAWKLQLMVNYAVVPYACWQGLSFVNHLASLATLLLALTGSWVALGSWRKTGEELETERGGPLVRGRFMALSGMASGVFFALIILGQWIPNLLLSPCDGLS